jgi:hypothetical protein
VSNAIYPVLLLVAAIGGGTLALLHKEDPAPASGPASREATTEAPTATAAGAGTELPPNHPAIGAGGSAHGSGAVAPPPSSEDERAAVSWKVPVGWQTLANPTSIRLATYAIPGVGGAAGADVSVSRAGGGTEANIDRWVRQFDDAGQEKRTEKTVRGLKVVIVEVGGTYLGSGMLPTPEATEHANDKKSWALLGAVIETPGSSYFFKMTGPAATVKRAHKDFEALVDSVTPVTE